MSTLAKRMTTKPAARIGANSKPLDNRKIGTGVSTSPQQTGKLVMAKESPSKTSASQTVTPSSFKARAGRKQEQLIDLLSREAGASIAEIAAKLGWLPHTVRAALTGLRRKGCQIERLVSEDGKRAVHRIIPMKATPEKRLLRQRHTKVEA